VTDFAASGWENKNNQRRKIAATERKRYSTVNVTTHTIKNPSRKRDAKFTRKIAL